MIATRFPDRTRCILATAAAVSALVLTGVTTGCTTKNYVRAQTAPIVAQTNSLDERTAADHRDIVATDQRAQSGIAGANAAASQANQDAQSASQAAGQANTNAQEATNRVDTLSGVVANLDNYQQLSDVSVTFATAKATLTAADKRQLDTIAQPLATTRGYLLEVTGGTDSVGGAQYNYELSQRRADAVVQYLSTRYSIAPHRFYLVGIGKDVQVASDHTAAGRAKNRRVEVKVLSNMTQPANSATAAPATSGAQ